uniref:Putative zinc finger protein 814 n=5 Tax=Pararge aegeria TaxID=116150 RepID=S4PQA7_9NEOP
MKQHTGDTPHACKVCSKHFTRKEHLVTHMRSHSCGDRPYSCGECGKSFPLKGNLLFHERSHKSGNTKQFRCEICSKEFMCKGHLVSHRRTHSDGGDGGTNSEPTAENEECGDYAKCEDTTEMPERKHDIRATIDNKSNDNTGTQTQLSTVMQITSQQPVRAGAVSSAASVAAGTFTHTASNQHHAGTTIAHHPVTVNY